MGGLYVGGRNRGRQNCNNIVCCMCVFDRRAKTSESILDCLFCRPERRKGIFIILEQRTKTSDFFFEYFCVCVWWAVAGYTETDKCSLVLLLLLADVAFHLALRLYCANIMVNVETKSTQLLETKLAISFFNLKYVLLKICCYNNNTWIEFERRRAAKYVSERVCEERWMFFFLELLLWHSIGRVCVHQLRTSGIHSKISPIQMAKRVENNDDQLWWYI